MLLLLLMAGPAEAFSPRVHRALSVQAAMLEGRDPAAAREFGRAAADEDWNLARKWSRWHHYHSPSFAPVRSLWRGPSARRVARLEAGIRAAVADGELEHAWLLAGHLAHHVQDMASPPHVVPVAHGLNDGFESYVTAPLVLDVASRAPGVDVPTLTAAEAHQHLAEDTTAALAVPLVCETEAMPWSTFWEPHPGAFGVYGSAGNRFGRLPACEAGMRTFAEARLLAALAYTRAVVRFVAGLEAGG